METARPETVGRLFVVSGPSAVGKDTVLAAALLHVDSITRSVSATTRPGRKDGHDARDYHFLSKEEFRNRVARGEFLEHAEYDGFDYGTPRAPVEADRARGIDVILKIDVQGAGQVRTLAPEAILVFIQPPSMEDLERRIRRREPPETEESIRRRLAAARTEMACIPMYDYLVTNEEEKVEECADRVRAIIIAERSRIRPCASTARTFSSE